QVGEKFEAVELGCDLLRKETNIILQQSMSTQLRLAFMFQMAEETGLTNGYVAQLLKCQAQLNPQTLSTRASP
ncbi:hypothetical protein E1A91_A02G047900v1, partial [Gossypium mustelinum]